MSGIFGNKKPLGIFRGTINFQVCLPRYHPSYRKSAICDHSYGSVKPLATITGRSVVAYSCIGKFSAALLRNEYVRVTLPTRSFRRLSESGLLALFSFIAFKRCIQVPSIITHFSCIVKSFFDFFRFNLAKTGYILVFRPFPQQF